MPLALSYLLAIVGACVLGGFAALFVMLAFEVAYGVGKDSESVRGPLPPWPQKRRPWRSRDDFIFVCIAGLLFGALWACVKGAIDEQQNKAEMRDESESASDRWLNLGCFFFAAAAFNAGVVGRGFTLGRSHSRAQRDARIANLAVQKELLDLYRKKGDWIKAAEQASALATILWSEGDEKGGLIYQQEALELSAASGGAALPSEVRPGGPAIDASHLAQAVSLYASPPSPQSDPTKLQEEAAVFAKAGRLEEAITRYRQALQQTPRDWNIVRTIGDLLFKLDRLEEASAEYAKVAESYAEDGFLMKAVVIWSRLLAFDSTNPVPFLKLGDLYARQGRMRDAKERYQCALDLYDAQERTREAGNTLKRMAEIDPTDLKIRSRLADLYTRDGDVGRASEEHIDIAGELTRRGHIGKAIQVLEKGLTIDPRNDLLRAELEKLR